MSPEREEREIMDYYEGTADDPLEAVNEILRMLDYRERTEIGFWNEDTGKMVHVNDYTERISPINFSVSIFSTDGKSYSLAGTAKNRGLNDNLKPVWDAGAELEPVEFLTQQ